MTDRTDSLHALIAQWREEASAEFHEMGNTQYASGLDKCADELSALLLEGVERPQGGEEVERTETR